MPQARLRRRRLVDGNLIAGKRRFYIASLPVTAATAAAAPPPPAAFAMLGGFARLRRWRAHLVRLGGKASVVGAAAVVILVRDGVLGHRIMRERGCFARLAATPTPTTASAPPPATTVALGAWTMVPVAAMRLLGLRLARCCFEMFGFVVGFRLGFDRLLARFVLDDFVVLFLDWPGQFRLHRGDRLGGFRRMHLLAAIDDERLLAGDGRIGRHRDGDAEAFFQRAQVRALVIEHIKGDFRARAYQEIVRGALDQHFLDAAQQLQRHRRHRTHMA